MSHYNSNGEWDDYFGAGADIVRSLQAGLSAGKAKREYNRVLNESHQVLTGYVIRNNGCIDNKKYSVLGRNVAYSTYMAVSEKINSLGIQGVSSDGIGGLGFYLYKTYSFKVDQVRYVDITDGARSLLSSSISKNPVDLDGMYASFVSTLTRNMALDNIGLTAQAYVQRVNYPSSILETIELSNSKSVKTETWDRILDRVLEKNVRSSEQINEVENSIC